MCERDIKRERGWGGVTETALKYVASAGGFTHGWRGNDGSRQVGGISSRRATPARTQTKWQLHPDQLYQAVQRQRERSPLSSPWLLTVSSLPHILSHTNTELKRDGERKGDEKMLFKVWLDEWICLSVQNTKYTYSVTQGKYLDLHTSIHNSSNTPSGFLMW